MDVDAKLIDGEVYLNRDDLISAFDLMGEKRKDYSFNFHQLADLIRRTFTI